MASVPDDEAGPDAPHPPDVEGGPVRGPATDGASSTDAGPGPRTAGDGSWETTFGDPAPKPPRRFWDKLIRPALWRKGRVLRGRVNRVSRIASGETSVVVRFGMDEPEANKLLPGTMIEVVELRGGIPAKDAKR